MRLSFALVMISSCLLLSAEMFGFTPQEDKFELESRTKISESIALQMSILIPDQEIKKIQKLIRLIVKRNPEILSAGIRLESGQLIFKSANHVEFWGDYDKKASTSTHVYIPVLQRGKLWGNVELRYEALESDTFLGFFNRSIFKLISFISIIGFFVFMVFMLRTIRQLDPSAIIPERVNAAFDTLAEGVLIVDEDENILLANKAFCNKILRPPESLLGHKVTELDWKSSTDGGPVSALPWQSVIKTGKNTVGSPLSFQVPGSETIKFAINAAPILDDKNKSQGVLITLDDISDLEQRNTNLKSIVTNLQKSQFQVQQQNKELNYLATRDPLTGCLNRRAFNEKFESLFNDARANSSELACVMVDIDHFKQVNDNFGHSTGDEVIKLLAEILKSNTRTDDLVARYGGEEFCLVLPNISDDVAIKTAERIRLRIKDESTSRYENGPHVTASLGIASLLDNPDSPEDLNNLADQALYVAKETGRNRVIRWNAEYSAEEKSPEKPISESISDPDTPETVDSLKNRIRELEDIASSVSAQLEYQQSYDDLTGLPNQILFYDRISQAIERGYRHDEMTALLIVDIEMFSQINTSLGRSVGDQLLQKFSERLQTIFHRSDGVSRLTVSRLAADEFAVLLTDVNKQEQVTWAVKRLLDSSNDSIEIEGHTIHLRTRTGISLYPVDANSVDELVNHAMTAKKFCKERNTQNKHLFFDQHMQENSLKQIQLEKELRSAISNKEWVLMFQPKLDITQNKIIGAEALIRWQHPERGMLSPFEFIDFAERHKLIIPIGDWVIEQACRQIKQLLTAGINDCKIAINLSSIQLIQTNIVEKICSQLELYKIPPRMFEIEITETTLIDNIQAASESLKRLNARGIPIAIDDFGTGYSSLSYLKNLPVNSLKIDRTFIKDICHNQSDRQIVKTLISMAHSLDLKVIAEGVEEQSQLELLKDFDCDEIQGYLFAKPMSSGKLMNFVQGPPKIEPSSEKVVQLRP